MQKRRHAGFSMVELLVVISIIMIILAIAIPSVHKARMNAAEVIVAREVQTIQQAQMQYMSQYGKYARSLGELGPPDHGEDSPGAASLIPRKLAKGEKDGYLFSLTATATGFAISAVPKSFGSSGRRTFYEDQDGIVHQNWGSEPATRNSPELE
jgi:type IV pilus assembly protein PilA